MANTYVGPATILCDGTETEVTARLAADRSGALASWDGEVREPGTDFWDIFQADSAQLRLPDGTVGNFISTNYSAGADTLQIKGSGPAPF